MVKNPLAVFAVVMGGIQLFFQMVEAQKLVEGKWWSLAAVAVAAIVLTINGYLHAYQQKSGESGTSASAGTTEELPQMPCLTAEPVTGATSTLPPGMYTTKAALSAFGLGLAERLRP